MKSLVFVLEDLRSVYNVASIFRTADTLSVDKIFLVGTSPAPTDRFGRERPDFAKVALGTQKTVPWEEVEDKTKMYSRLKSNNYLLCALEQDERSVDIRNFKAPENLAIIVGNEPNGVSKESLNAADKILEIPLFGQKESLNASVALAVAAFYLKLKSN